MLTFSNVKTITKCISGAQHSARYRPGIDHSDRSQSGLLEPVKQMRTSKLRTPAAGTWPGPDAHVSSVEPAVAKTQHGPKG